MTTIDISISSFKSRGVGLTEASCKGMPVVEKGTLWRINNPCNFWARLPPANGDIKYETTSGELRWLGFGPGPAIQPDEYFMFLGLADVSVVDHKTKPGVPANQRFLVIFFITQGIVGFVYRSLHHNHREERREFLHQVFGRNLTRAS